MKSIYSGFLQHFAAPLRFGKLAFSSNSLLSNFSVSSVITSPVISYLTEMFKLFNLKSCTQNKNIHLKHTKSALICRNRLDDSSSIE